MHVKTGGIVPQYPQYGPIGDAWSGIGPCGMNCPAQYSGMIERQQLQPA
jgi:hypothetical protein